MIEQVHFNGDYTRKKSFAGTRIRTHDLLSTHVFCLGDFSDLQLSMLSKQKSRMAALINPSVDARL